MANVTGGIAGAPQITQKFENTRVLLCEGPDDARFYETLIKKRNLPDFQIIPVQKLNGSTGGVPGFAPSMIAIRPWTSLRIVKLLVLAADHEPGVFLKLKSVLKANGFDYPQEARTNRVYDEIGQTIDRYSFVADRQARRPRDFMSADALSEMAKCPTMCTNVPEMYGSHPRKVWVERKQLG